MTSWSPWLADIPGPFHRRLVAALQQDIAAGRLLPETRLPTHRALARALSTTVVTASRAYREAAALGLIHGTVGRGTFVAPRADAAAGTAEDLAAASVAGSPLAAEAAPLLDLGANVIAAGADPAGTVPRPAVAALLWNGLAQRHPPGGASNHRAAGAAWLRRAGWEPRPAGIVATGGAQHAILVTLAALVRPGDRILVESLTYPGIRTAAQCLGLQLVPVPIDGDGLVPEALAALCAAGPAPSSPPPRLLLCQPSLHNPTSAVMPAERRRAIAAIARRHDLAIVEDCVYEFLLDDPPPPLAALAPERTCHIVSGSKALAQGLRLGYIAAPEPLVPALQAQIAATGLAASPSWLDLAAHWIATGAAHRLTTVKRQEARLRQQLARTCLHGLSWLSHPASSHLWLRLPPPWQAAAFVDQARRQGIAVNPAGPFAADPAAAPAAVRLCLGAVADRRQLEGALNRLAGLLAGPPPPEEPVV
jgi:DNA-binding transcriptional MocR family regulator